MHCFMVRFKCCSFDSNMAIIYDRLLEKECLCESIRSLVLLKYLYNSNSLLAQRFLFLKGVVCFFLVSVTLFEVLVFLWISLWWVISVTRYKLYDI